MTTIKRLNTHMKGSRGGIQLPGRLLPWAAFFGLLQPQIIRIVLDVGIGEQDWNGASCIGTIISRFGGGDQIKRLILPAAGISVIFMGISGLFLYFKGRWKPFEVFWQPRRWKSAG